MATTKTRRSSSSIDVVVLGGGMVGSVIASDLAANRGLKVTVVDARPEALKRCAARAPKKIATVEADLEAGSGIYSIDQRNQAGTATVTGACGLGLAPWANEFDLPTRRAAEAAVERPPKLDPTQVPTFEDYPPMACDLTRDRAVSWSTDRLADTDPRYLNGDTPLAHPSWAPGQMTPLIRHSYRFGIGVHAVGRVQHLAPIRAGQTVTVAGRWTDAWVKKGRQWSTTDAVFLDDAGTELAHCRQTVVFLA